MMIMVVNKEDSEMRSKRKEYKETSAILDNWVIIYYPDSGVVSLSGDIYGDTRNRFGDGTRIYTTRLVDLEDPEKLEEGSTVNTLNSTYLLGHHAKIEDYKINDNK